MHVLSLVARTNASTSSLILEDDVDFSWNFSSTWSEIAGRLPETWKQIYLGYSISDELPSPVLDGEGERKRERLHHPMLRPSIKPMGTYGASSSSYFLAPSSVSPSLSLVVRAFLARPDIPLLVGTRPGYALSPSFLPILLAHLTASEQLFRDSIDTLMASFHNTLPPDSVFSLVPKLVGHLGGGEMGTDVGEGSGWHDDVGEGIRVRLREREKRERMGEDV